MPHTLPLAPELTPPLPSWAQQPVSVALWYGLSRLGDHGRLPPFRHLTQLSQYLYLGGQVSRSGWRVLEKWGISAVVNMRAETDDRAYGIHPPHYLWIPTIDGTPPTVEQLAEGVRFIHQQRVAGRTTYVHCAGGLGRAPTQAIAYLIARGMTPDRAIGFVRAHRPFIQLSAWQRKQLDHFATYWEAQRSAQR